MKIKTNENNIEDLKTAIENTKKEILICSPWLRGEVLNRILSKKLKTKIIEGKINLKIILRISNLDDIKISGAELFAIDEELGEHCEIRYNKTLHTKLYVIDGEYALIGSFNLTGGGFGNARRPGNNLEAGVEYTDKEHVKEMKELFYTIWDTQTNIIRKELLGFCLNKTNSNIFSMVGIKPLETGKFVQINNADGSIILGQICSSEKYNIQYFFSPADQVEFNPRLFETFVNEFEFMNKANGIALSEYSQYSQLNVGIVSIKSELNVKENENVLILYRDVNRIAPDVAAEVLEADRDVLINYFGKTNCRPAVLISNKDVEVGFDEEELLSKHMAIFGATGSGKSYFTKMLISNYLKEWMQSKKGRIIIIDPHGEYAKGVDFENVLKSKNIIPNEKDIEASNLSTIVINDVDDLIEVCNLPRLSRAQKDFLDNALRKSEEKTEKFLTILCKENEKKDSETSIDINWEQYLKDDVDGIFYKYLDSFAKIAKKKIEDEQADGSGLSADEKRNRKKEIILELFHKLPVDKQEKIKKHIVDRQIEEFDQQFRQETNQLIDDEIIEQIKNAADEKVFRLESHDFIKKVTKPGIYCINLNEINDEKQRFELAADIFRGVFEKAKRHKNDSNQDFTTLFVVEEAHNFAPEHGSKHNPAYKYMKKIASEGRKFGVGMIVVTQRPAYVSKDILAQCNTQAIFRLINPNDISAVKEVVEGVSEQELKNLPHYIKGQCIFTGVAINEPVVVKVKDNKL